MGGGDREWSVFLMGHLFPQTKVCPTLIPSRTGSWTELEGLLELNSLYLHPTILFFLFFSSGVGILFKPAHPRSLRSEYR